MSQGRILIVEDEPAVGRALARSLRREGYTVDTAASHADALSFFDEYDCGVFDIDLPDSDGIELAARLRQRGKVKQVVFFTGASEAHTEIRARTEGVYVHKSEGVARLREAIAQVLGG